MNVKDYQEDRLYKLQVQFDFICSVEKCNQLGQSEDANCLEHGNDLKMLCTIIILVYEEE